MKKTDAKKLMQEDPERAAAIIVAAVKVTNTRMMSRGEVSISYDKAKDALWELLYPEAAERDRKLQEEYERKLKERGK